MKVNIQPLSCFLIISSLTQDLEELTQLTPPFVPSEPAAPAFVSVEDDDDDAMQHVCTLFFCHCQFSFPFVPKNWTVQVKPFSQIMHTPSD